MVKQNIKIVIIALGMVTAVFTSCGRFDLLKRTVDSFFNYLDISVVHKVIVIDNSTLDNAYKEIKNILDLHLIDYHIIVNEENIGQVSSIDKAYSKVETDYIFHCEDDWEFFDKGFMNKSINLLQDRRDVINVNLRVRFDGERGSMHPISELKASESGVLYHEYLVNYLGAWHGFSWNPGLRRKYDYDLIAPYKQYGEESGVGKKYKDLGFVAACLENSYCKHIGTNSTTPKSNQ